jgi:hypothetical protein
LITEKYNLLHVLQRFSEQQKENVFDILPVTFYIEMSDPTVSTIYQQSMQQFTDYWRTLETHRSHLKDMHLQLLQQFQQAMDSATTSQNQIKKLE